MSLPMLHCHRIGQGPDLVMLHGWGLHAGIWETITAPLAARFRLHLFDLPGHGHSAQSDAFTLASLCTALAQEAPPQAHWLGWSLGGTLALAFAARYPQRVSRLLLVAHNPRFVADASWPQALAADVLEGFAQGLSDDYAATVKRFVSLVARGAPDSTVLRQLRHAMAAAPPPSREALCGGLAILRDTDLRPQLSALSMPVLWLGGARDTLVPIAALRSLVAAYPHMQLREFAHAGHAPFISHPQEFAAAVTEFLV